MARPTKVDDDAERIANSIIDELRALEEPTHDQISEIVIRRATRPRTRVRSSPSGTVDSISIAGIRGFGPVQTIRLSRGLTIIHASNGVGKTSICDALELHTLGVTTRALQHPEAAVEVKDLSTVPHQDTRGVKTPDPMVTVTWRPTGSEDPTATTWPGTFGKPSSPPAPIAVVPRRLLRDILGARQTERMERLGESLDVHEVTNLWHLAARIIRSEAASLPQPDEDLTSLLAATPEDVAWHRLPHAEVVARISEKLLQDASISVGPEQRTPISRIVDDAPPVGSPPRPPDTDVAILGIERLNACTQLVPEVPSLLPLLREFAEHARAGTTCPMCEEGEVTDRRLAEIRALVEVADDTLRWRAQHAEALEAIRTVVTSLPQWSVANAPIDWAVEGDSLTDAWRQTHSRLSAVATEWNSLRERLTAVASGQCELTHDVADDLRKLEVMHQASLDLLERLERDRAFIAERNTTSRQLFAEADAREAARVERIALYLEASSRRKLFSQALECASDTLLKHLESHIDERIANLAEPINSWLDRLRPAGTPRITVKRAKTSGRPGVRFRVASADSCPTASSTNQMQAPDALARFSDSQLDMLGLAIHLARLDRENPGAAIVLDDPTDMLDTETLTQFVQVGIVHMLDGSDAQVARQVVVVTHCRELVRKLWSATILHRPRTVQDFIEEAQTDTDRHAVLASRGTAEIYRRTEQFREEHWSKDRGQLWFRSAFGNQVRRCVEMLAQDLAAMSGLSGRAAFSDPSGSAGLMMAAVNDHMQSALERITSCSNKRFHGPTTRLRRQLCEFLTGWNDHWLNPSSHADVVLPSVDNVKALHVLIGQLAAALEGSPTQPRDKWAESCELARGIETCSDCPQGA